MTRVSAGQLASIAGLLVVLFLTNQPARGRQNAPPVGGQPLVGHQEPGGDESGIDVGQARADAATHHPITSSSSTTSTTSTVTNTSPTAGCNAATEFRCQIEDRCVPLEWRCDFTEQCLSGQDELGCASEWCNFDRDSCYWINKLDDTTTTTTKPPEAAARGSKATRRPGVDERPAKAWTRASYWRRFLPAARRLKEAPASTQLAHLLERLSLNSTGRAKFVFVPLELHADELSTLYGQPRGNNKLVKRARIATPQIGRTNSRCQLRFEYALWTPARSPLLEGSLSLVARWAGANTSRPLWTRSSAELEGARGAGAIDWTVGVAELGHLSRFELSFEARLVANLPAGARQERAASVADGRSKDKRAGADRPGLWLANERPAASSNHTQTLAAEKGAFEGAIVALRWLQFHDCRWPRAASAVSSLNADDDTGDRSFELLLEGSVPMAPEGSDQETCLERDELQCSNGICVPTRRACDSVDNCMAPAGLEDEAPSLCGPLADSSENFDSLSLGSKHMQLFLTSRPDKFWHLTGNWTINRASVTSNPRGLSHLPRLDHSSHKSTGRFLSLELPEVLELGPSSGRRALFWASINSRWMEKRESASHGPDCRLKFFYNLVSSRPRELYANSSWPPFKLTLAVQHHKVRARVESVGQERERWEPASKQLDAFIHSHAIDGSSVEMLQLQPEVIEYPGVDFWREANVRLSGLQPGELFYMRLLIFVEFTAQPVGRQRASINLDDLNTHFGCGPTLPASADTPTQERHFDHELLALLKPRRRESTPVVPYYPMMRDRLRRYDYSNWFPNSADKRSEGAASEKLATSDHRRSHQVEAQKLVAYVSGAFLVMIGIIAVIVFVLVPHVERAMMNYQDQIQLSLSGEISDSPISRATIYELSAGSSSTRRAAKNSRPRTWSFDSLTSTGFGSAPLAAANKRSSQRSISTSRNCSQAHHMGAPGKFDHQLTGPPTGTKNLNFRRENNGAIEAASETSQPKAKEELHDEFNSSAIFCVQDSISIDDSINDSSSSWQLHSEPLYESPLACDMRRPSASASRELVDTPHRETTS